MTIETEVPFAVEPVASAARANKAAVQAPLRQRTERPVP